MTDRRAHLFYADDTSRPLCGAQVQWQDSPTPDEAEACVTCDLILSKQQEADYD